MRKYEGVGVWGEEIPSSLKSEESKCEALTASTMQSGMKPWCHHGRAGTLVKPVLFLIVPLHHFQSHYANGVEVTMVTTDLSL